MFTKFEAASNSEVSTAGMTGTTPTENQSCSELFDLTVEPQVHKRNIFHIRIGSEIGLPKEYTELINALRRAKDDDEIHIYLNSPGGYLCSTVEIVNAMTMCRGTVITHACGTVASAATLIFLAGHGQVIHEGISFMCHYYSTGMGGKGQEIESYAKWSKKSNQKIMWRFYEGFLKKDEFKRMCKGEDFWMDCAEVARRLKRRIKKLGLDEGEEVREIDLATGETETVKSAKPSKKKNKSKKSKSKKSK
jgi:ATP-dependent protease ClpP protease subunit